jgi:hypothetical protein
MYHIAQRRLTAVAVALWATFCLSLALHWPALRTRLLGIAAWLAAKRLQQLAVSADVRFNCFHVFKASRMQRVRA